MSAISSGARVYRRAPRKAPAAPKRNYRVLFAFEKRRDANGTTWLGGDWIVQRLNPAWIVVRVYETGEIVFRSRTYRDAKQWCLDQSDRIPA